MKEIYFKMDMMDLRLNLIIETKIFISIFFSQRASNMFQKGSAETSNSSKGSSTETSNSSSTSSYTMINVSSNSNPKANISFSSFDKSKEEYDSQFSEKVLNVQICDIKLAGLCKT